MTKVIAVLALLALVGCNKDQPGQSGGAAKVTPPAPTAGTEKPASPAAGSPKAGEPGNPLQALAQLAKAGEALSKVSQKQLGPVVNWRELQPFAPAKLGEFEAEGELDGNTGGLGEMKISTVKRRYKAGDKKLRLEISDTSLVPMLRAGFAIAAQIQEDSTQGLKKGVTLEGQPGIVEWSKASQRGKVALLVGGRYVVNLQLQPTPDSEAVVKLAKQLDLKKLAEVKAKE